MPNKSQILKELKCICGSTKKIEDGKTEIRCGNCELLLAELYRGEWIEI